MKKFAGFQHGINLGGWFSQCDHTKETYEEFIKEEDFRRIREWGLDHVRLPIDYDLVEQKDGTRIEEGFGYLKRAVSWAKKYGLNLVLDLHKTYGYSFDSGEGEGGFFENETYQERFYSLWEELARRFSSDTDMLAFELLNEVTEKSYCREWNRIAAAAIGRIRKIAPDVPILVGGYYNNSIEALPDLDPPADEHVIYNFHCYEPLIFTHQGAYWVPGMDTSFRLSLDEPYRVLEEKTGQYITQAVVGFDGFDPDSALGEEYFDRYFKEAVRIAEERNTALYCGEYGVIDLADPEETLKWYRLISSVFEKYGIGRAAWNYRAKDFGFIDPHMEGVLDEIVTLL